MKTTKEQIINELEEIIKYNKAARQASCLELFKDSSRKSNDVLAKAKNYIKSSDEYERGLNDAWELARLIHASTNEGGLAPSVVKDIFGCYFADVVVKYTVSDALSTYNDWLKKKEEEAAKPKLGDVVEVISNRDGFVEKGIFLSECFNTIKYLNANGVIVEAWYDAFKFVKTGEHVDIQGMLDTIG